MRSMSIAVLCMNCMISIYASQSNADLNKSYHKLPITKYTRMELEKIDENMKKAQEIKKDKEDQKR